MTHVKTHKAIMSLIPTTLSESELWEVDQQIDELLTRYASYVRNQLRQAWVAELTRQLED